MKSADLTWPIAAESARCSLGSTMIPRDLYAQIHSLMPILCVDVVIVNRGCVLLLKRSVEPLKGSWYFPGGRLHRGETVIEAAYRVVRQECGISIGRPVFIGYEDQRYAADPFGHKKGTRTVGLIFAASTMADVAKIDGNHTSYGWFDVRSLERGIHEDAIVRLSASACGLVRDEE